MPSLSNRKAIFIWKHFWVDYIVVEILLMFIIGPMNFYVECIPRIFLVLRLEGNALQVNAFMNSNWLHSSDFLSSQVLSYHANLLRIGIGWICLWTVNFQMFKLVLERAEEPEIKLPTSLKKYEIPEKHLLLFYWLCQSLWLCWSE